MIDMSSCLFVIISSLVVFIYWKSDGSSFTLFASSDNDMYVDPTQIWGFYYRAMFCQNRIIYPRSIQFSRRNYFTSVFAFLSQITEAFFIPSITFRLIAQVSSQYTPSHAFSSLHYGIPSDIDRLQKRLNINLPIHQNPIHACCALECSTCIS